MTAWYSKKAAGSRDSRLKFATCYLGQVTRIIFWASFSICKMRVFDYRFPKGLPAPWFSKLMSRGPEEEVSPRKLCIENGSKPLGFQACALALPSSPEDGYDLLLPPSPGRSLVGRTPGRTLRRCSEALVLPSVWPYLLCLWGSGVQPGLWLWSGAAPLCLGILGFLVHTQGL